MNKFRYAVQDDDQPTTVISPRRSGRRFAAIAVVAVSMASLVVATPAVAANNCNTAGYVCLWDYATYSGFLSKRPGGYSLVSNLPTSYQDKTASWGNDSAWDAGLWDELGATGQCWELPTYSSGTFGTFDRDRAESWRTLNGC